MRIAARIVAVLGLASCYTNADGERNLCIPGHDGICPAPELVHRYVPIAIVEPDPPVVLTQSVDDLSTTFEEISASSSRDIRFPGIGDERPAVTCDVTCAAVWRDAEDWSVLSSVRSSATWSAPERHPAEGPSVAPPAIARVGDVILIAWIERGSNQGGRVELRRLDPSGAVIDRATLDTEASPYSVSLTAAPDGALVSWKRAGINGVTTLFTQILAADGSPVGAPLEAPLEPGYESYRTTPVPAAYFEGAYHVVDDQIPGDASWAVIDPIARTITFETLSTAAWRKAIRSIVPNGPVAEGALVVLSGLSAGGMSIAHVANGAIVTAVDVPGGIVVIAPTADSYQLAQLDEGSLAIERRDAALQLVEDRTVIAASYQVDNTTCAVGRTHDAGIITLLCLVACRRRRRT